MVKEIPIALDQVEVLTFDCYGTLVDWETGIEEALRPILTAHQAEVSPEQVLELFGEFESQAERGDYCDYKTVLARVLQGFADRFGFAPSPAERAAFSLSVKDWPAFGESPAALRRLHQKYKLAILSNIDDDLFAFSERRLGLAFDWVITAQQARSYKPSLNNFRLAFERIGLPPQRILHVAQSLYHDIAPANALGLAAVWVNRRRGRPGFGATPPASAHPDLEVPDLQSLADLLGVVQKASLFGQPRQR